MRLRPRQRSIWLSRRRRPCWRAAHRQGTAAYPGVSLIDLADPLQAFRVASSFERGGSRAAYECSVVAARHPNVDVEAIFVRNGDVWTSAGVTTDIRPCARLIEQDAGREVAMNVARILVVYLKRAC